jgi:hypothetical protein
LKNYLTITADFYFERNNGSINAIIPATVAAMGESESQVAGMLEQVFFLSY